MPRRDDPTTTLVHRAPAVESQRPALRGLLAAFPRSAYLPMPPVGEPVGRAWLADHGLADSEVSTQHACFVRAGSQFALIDEGSRNGTFLDGERLGPRDTVTLLDGALIRMGRTLLVYREAITKTEPAPPLGNLVGPWGLGPLRKWLGSLHASGRWQPSSTTRYATRWRPTSLDSPRSTACTRLSRVSRESSSTAGGFYSMLLSALLPLAKQAAASS